MTARAVAISGATLVALLAVLTSSVRAQSGGVLFVATDTGATSRVLSDTPGVCTIYIVHAGFQAGAEFSAVRFKVDNNGFTGTWLGDTSDFATTGSSQTGIAVNYGGCLQPPILVLSVTYLCAGTSGCTTVTLVPDPLSNSGQIESADCSGTLLFPPGVYELCVNGVVVPDDTGFGVCDCPVPTEDKTWGRIKAIYE
jgi:hypothetical protein